MKIKFFLFLKTIILGVLLMGNQGLNAEENIKLDEPIIYSQVTAKALEYFDLLKSGDLAGLEVVLSPVWNGKYAQSKDEIFVENQDSLFARLQAGGILRELSNLEITSVQAFYPDYAMVRADDRANGAVSYLTLYKNKGIWQVAGETYTSSTIGVRNPHFNPATTADKVLVVMDTYYRAVELGEPTWLEPIFHADWHMKNPEAGEIVSEDKATFIDRIAERPLPGYFDDRQATDIQIVYEHMAIVRIDNPSTKSTTMFTYFKLNGDWIMVDKSWAYPPGSEH